MKALKIEDYSKPTAIQTKAIPLVLNHKDVLVEGLFNGKVKLSTLAAAVHPYPTIGEINKRVAGNFFSPKIFSDKVKNTLKFFFNLKGRACRPEEC